jgi:hypothetical protein
MSVENLPLYGREPWKPSGQASGFVHIRHFPGVGGPFSPLTRPASRESLAYEGRSQHFKPGLHLSPIKVRKIRNNSVARDTSGRPRSVATLPDPGVTGLANEIDPTLAILDDMSYEKENRRIQAPSTQKLQSQFPTKFRDFEPYSLSWLVMSR